MVPAIKVVSVRQKHHVFGRCEDQIINPSLKGHHLRCCLQSRYHISHSMSYSVPHTLHLISPYAWCCRIRLFKSKIIKLNIGGRQIIFSWSVCPARRLLLTGYATFLKCCDNDGFLNVIPRLFHPLSTCIKQRCSHIAAGYSSLVIQRSRCPALKGVLKLTSRGCKAPVSPAFCYLRLRGRRGRVSGRVVDDSPWSPCGCRPPFGRSREG